MLTTVLDFKMYFLSLFVYSQTLFDSQIVKWYVAANCEMLFMYLGTEYSCIFCIKSLMFTYPSLFSDQIKKNDGLGINHYFYWQTFPTYKRILRKIYSVIRLAYLNNI